MGSALPSILVNCNAGHGRVRSSARTRVVAPLLAALCLVLLGAACSGQKSEAPPAIAQQGALETPDAAVRALIDALVRRDREAFLRAVDPDFRGRPAELGVLVWLSLPLLSGREAGEVSFRDLSLRTTYEQNRAFASVALSALVSLGGSESYVTDEPLFTVRRGESWFVTSPSHPYWLARLGSRPTDANQAQLDDSPLLPGMYVPPYAGLDGILGTSDDRSHVRDGVVVPFCGAQSSGQPSVCYSSNPPTSGVHAQSAVPFGILTRPAPKESLVHSMEHGGVVVWHNTADQSVVRELAAVVDRALRRGDLVVMTPYTEMEPDTIALTAWTRLDKFPASEFTAQRVEAFIRAHSRRFNPEGF